MNIRLEYKGTVIHEVEMAQMVDEITIGRSQGCIWVTPREDGLASSKHASLQRKGKAVYVKDLDSTNGLYFQGRRIKQKKLENGDRLTLGDCVLVAEERKESSVASQPSRLVVLSGPAKGQRRDILPPRLTIGSSPMSDLGIMDMLVSKNHAEIVVKEGGCWIRDLGSKNGTTVNGVALRGDQDRLLKDNDHLSIAQFEIVFQDGAVLRTDSKLWLRVGVIGATVAACLLGFWLFQYSRPDAGSYLKRARSLAAAENFVMAKAQIEKAVNARAADRYENDIGNQRRLVTLWETSIKTWESAKKKLEKGDWIEASRDLGILAAAEHNAWGWKKDAAIQRDEAMLAKQLLDTYSKAQTIKHQSDIDMKEWLNQASQVKKFRDLLASHKAGYLAPLAVEYEKLSQDLDQVIRETQALEQAIARLNDPDPAFAQVIAVIAKSCGSTTESVRNRAEKLKEPIQALAHGYEMLQKANELLCNLKFNDVRDMQKALQNALPATELCAIDSTVSNVRGRLELSAKTVRISADQLGAYHTKLRKILGAEPTGPLPAIWQFWKDETIQAKVLACDSLQGPLPKGSRTDPEGKFDQAVCIGCFYNYLLRLPDSTSIEEPFKNAPFDPMVVSTANGAAQMELYLAFVTDPANRALVKEGTPLAETVVFMKAALVERDAIVASLWTKAQKLTGREAVIAGGMALCMAPRQANLKSADGQPAAAWLAGQLRNLGREMQALDTAYRSAIPEQQIIIRDQVLAKGLPDDPLVRLMWSRRKEPASAPLVKP
jgi:pSer/pThr/pTyr-binding forkhead associated (FHA) protein